MIIIKVIIIFIGALIMEFIIYIVCIIGVAIVFIHIFHAILVDRKVNYHRMDYYASSVSKELDGYKIIFIADIHDYSVKKLENDIAYLNKLEPDILLLGGDFPKREKRAKILEMLARISTKDGIYGVDGNHDLAEGLFMDMRIVGMIPLDNSGLRIKDQLYLAGVSDMWNRTPNIEKALQGAKEDDFVVLISHQPDVVMLQDTKQVDLSLAGHTHGGQITFFGKWKPISLLRWHSKYGQRFFGGWSKTAADTDIYVTNGLGMQSLRVFAQSEIVIVTLREEKK